MPEQIQLPKSIPSIFDVSTDGSKIILTTDFNDLNAWNRIQAILEGTNIPQHLYAQVRRFLPSHKQFILQDETLDTYSFVAAVSAEIDDWVLQLTTNENK